MNYKEHKIIISLSEYEDIKLQYQKLIDAFNSGIPVTLSYFDSRIVVHNPSPELRDYIKEIKELQKEIPVSSKLYNRIKKWL